MYRRQYQTAKWTSNITCPHHECINSPSTNAGPLFYFFLDILCNIYLPSVQSEVVFMECKTQFPLINKINALFLAANICSTNSTIRYWQNTALKGFFRDLYLNVSKNCGCEIPCDGRIG